MNEIVSLNNFIGKYVTSLEGVNPKAAIIDPFYITNLVSPIIAPKTKNELNGADFAKLSYQVAQLRNNVKRILKNGGVIVVVLSPYRTIVHEKHKDLIIGNYDWLWPEAGNDSKLEIINTKPDTFQLTEYAQNSPFSEYLQKQEIITDVAAKGEFRPLAMDVLRRSISFLMFRENGKVVFIPRSNTWKKLLLTSIKEALDPECWSSSKIVKDIKPNWINSYSFPESEYLEQLLTEKEEEIHKIEDECEQIHEKLSTLKQLRNSLFTSNASRMGNAISAIIMQWGVKIVPEEYYLTANIGKRKGIILPAVIGDQAHLWVAKKLLRILPKNQKGIVIVNPYRYESPRYRKHCYSQALINFTEENNIALTSIMDIFYAHCDGFKDFVECLWNSKGLVEYKPSALAKC